MSIRWILLLLAVWVAPSSGLQCYNCSCVGPICPCTTYEVSSSENTYCIIERDNYYQRVSIDYGHVGINSTLVYIREFPFVLIEESIIYNERTGRWNTQPEIVVYGCKTDLCNKPELLPYLPSSFQMRLSESWLNESILGSGLPVRSCHQCPDEPVCSDTEFIDPTECPIEECNTTCLVSDLISDPVTNSQCYQSFCAPTDSDGYLIDTHRVDIEGILYSSRPNEVEVWEIDLYCRADNCSRPTIFKELRNELTTQSGDLSLLFNLNTNETRKIRCYDCQCTGTVNCSCDTVNVFNADTTHCTIQRNNDGENVYVYFTGMSISSSGKKYREFPYARAKESIAYDNETGEWVAKVDEVTYGCNWDYCNQLSLLQFLPGGFQMGLDESWLNSTLLGAGEPLSYCNQCPDDICNPVGTVEENECPAENCTTSCFGSKQYTGLPNSDLCYESYCVPEGELEGDGAFANPMVRMEAFVYRARPTNIELSEVSLYCTADSCSRPQVFSEIEDKITVDLSSLSNLFSQNSVGDPGYLRCYDCYCPNDPICACNNTIALPANETYCTVIREYDGQNFWIFLEHIDRNSTRVYIREFPYMLVEETILYNDAINRWITQPTLIVYGCNTDFCNDPRLVPRLPISFQMRLSDAWLEKNVRGNGSTIRDCHECPDAPQCGTTDFLDASRCPIRPCNTTCLVSDLFDDPAVDEQCYQSFCAPPDNGIFTIDPHRVEIEGILYGNRLDAKVELWEVDIYCQADDCSRPEIFKELRSELVVDTGDLSAFFNITTTPTTTPPPFEPPLACYECACYDDPNCSCSNIGVSGAYSSYCTIVQLNDPDGDFLIQLQHIDRNSTRIYIRKFPYLLAEESIIYNETTGKWSTRTNLIVYGCNWDYCNHPSLVPLLPSSFQMELSEEWLNKNVLGNGSTIRDCHECPDAPQCGSETFLDDSRCPIQPCNTTCLVSDIYDDPQNGDLCYQSYCAPPDNAQFTTDPHRVEIEGLIYGDQINKVELWEIDIYCQADDCSRPQIFEELRANLTVKTTNLTVIFDNSTKPPIEPQLTCYDCSCFDEPNCTCDKYTAQNAKDSYCIIIEQIFGSFVTVDLRHIERNSTRVYIRDFPYLLTEESIIYDNVTQTWNTRTNLVVFGCNWDYCNHPRYIPALPNSFQMRLPQAWLNQNVLGTGRPVRDCHECPAGPVCSNTSFVDGSQCPVQSCNTTCLVSDVYGEPSSNLQCYDSYCAPPDSETFTIDPHRVELEGILYLNPPGRLVELWEIDIFCRADDCSRPGIFDEIRNLFTTQLIDIDIFYNITNPVTSSTQTSTRTTTTTTRTSTNTNTNTQTPTRTTTTTSSRPSSSSSSSSPSTSPTGSSGSTSGGQGTTSTAGPNPTTSQSAMRIANTGLIFFFFTLTFLCLC